jgi:hypothetical protein
VTLNAKCDSSVPYYSTKKYKSKAAFGLLLVYYLKFDLEVSTFFDARCADLDTRTIRNACPLKVRVYATVATRVELGSTNRVGVLSNNFRSFFAE